MINKTTLFSVTKSGMPLDKSLYTWDEKTRTFSSDVPGLVLDFSNVDNCTFKTGSGCTFNTGLDCTFNTGLDCTFKTGWNCTFETCHKCVIIRRDIFEVITPEEGEIVKLCPFEIPGYISKKPGEDAFYMQCGSERTEYIIADGILSKVISKKQIKDFAVYKVVNHNEKEISFVVYDGENYSHGSTVKEAKEDLRFKISNRDISKYKNLALSDKLTIPEAIKMYRTITGACERGTKYFVQNTELEKKKYSIQEIIELTKGQYNHNKLENFFRQTHPAV